MPGTPESVELVRLYHSFQILDESDCAMIVFDIGIQVVHDGKKFCVLSGEFYLTTCVFLFVSEIRALWRYEGVVRDQIVLCDLKSLCKN
jgi:hypothetical protein